MNVLRKLGDWLDKFSYLILAPAAILLLLAPLTPEPHLVEKTRMLFDGHLTRPIDIFDLFMHSAPAMLLVAKIARDIRRRRRVKLPE